MLPKNNSEVIFVGHTLHIFIQGARDKREIA
jgi:hypothetical protein